MRLPFCCFKACILGAVLLPALCALADDDTDDCAFFKQALEQLSLSTHLTIVNDGDELMNYLLENSDHPPHVLFLDINMPRKNGLECLSEIKQNIRLKDMPVVMFSTSYTSDKNYEQSMIDVLYKMGAQGFIRKPGEFTELKQVIHDALVEVIGKARSMEK